MEGNTIVSLAGTFHCSELFSHWGKCKKRGKVCSRASQPSLNTFHLLTRRFPFSRSASFVSFVCFFCSFLFKSFDTDIDPINFARHIYPSWEMDKLEERQTRFIYFSTFFSLSQDTSEIFSEWESSNVCLHVPHFHAISQKTRDYFGILPLFYARFSFVITFPHPRFIPPVTVTVHSLQDGGGRSHLLCHSSENSHNPHYRSTCSFVRYTLAASLDDLAYSRISNGKGLFFLSPFSKFSIISVFCIACQRNHSCLD